MIAREAPATIQQTVRLACALMGGALLYLFILGLFWVPRTRHVDVVVRDSGASRLRVSPDIGRGFYARDSLVRDLPGSPGPERVDLPLTTTRLKLELESANPTGLIERVSFVASDGASVASSVAPGRSVTVSRFPALSRDIPPLGHVVSGVFALGIVALSLSVAPLRQWAGRLRSAILEPSFFCSFRGMVVLWVSFAALLLALGRAVDVYDVVVRHVDNPPYWPISIFDPAEVTATSVFGAACVALAFQITRRTFWTGPRIKLLPFLTFGLLSLVLLNLLHGWKAGYVEPTAGRHMYLSDALAIQSVPDFLSSFTTRQLGLSTHARTHPPGALLLYWFLSRFTHDPGVMSLALGAGSFGLGSWFLFHLVKRHAGPAGAALAVSFFALTPAIQVYFISSLDAFVCASSTGALYFFLRDDKGGTRLLAAVFLLLSLLVTFGAVFLLGAFAFHELLSKRSVRSTSIVASIAGFALLLLWGVTGFNWWESFGIATARENPHGFALLHDPGSYFFTRLEGVAELALFASPLLLLAWWRTLSSKAYETNPLRTLSISGTLCLLLMLVSGAFKTGETARACLFVYPLLIAPLALLNEDSTFTTDRQHHLAAALVAQTLVMQVLGDYYW